MIATRLVTYGVFALGALMVVVGLTFVSLGVPIVRMEIGWTEIIGGAVAASAGAVILALGAVLLQLEAMQQAIEGRVLGAEPAMAAATAILRPTMAEPVVEETTYDVRPVHPLAPGAKRDQPLPMTADVRPEPALPAALHPDGDEDVPSPAHVEKDEAPEPVLAESAPALVHAEEEESAQGPTVVAPDPVADPVADAPPPSRVKPGFLSSLLARRTASPPERRRPAAFERIMPDVERVGLPGTPQRSVIDLSSGWDEDVPPPPSDTPSESIDAVSVEMPAPAHPEEPSPAASEPASENEQTEAPVAVSVPPAPEPDPLRPVVVGRYNAGAASYVMYSNGMIEVETDQGTHQFASMQELKAFIEKRDTSVP